MTDLTPADREQLAQVDRVRVCVEKGDLRLPFYQAMRARGFLSFRDPTHLGPARRVSLTPEGRAELPGARE